MELSAPRSLNSSTGRHRRPRRSGGRLVLHVFCGLIGDWRGLVPGHRVPECRYGVVIMIGALLTVDIVVENAPMGLGASRLRAISLVTVRLIRSARILFGFQGFISWCDELVIA